MVRMMVWAAMNTPLTTNRAASVIRSISLSAIRPMFRVDVPGALIEKQEIGSQTMMEKLRVSQAAECLVGVRVVDVTSSRHHKFKVTSVMLSRFVEYAGAQADYTHGLIAGAIEAAGGGGAR